MVPLNFLKAPQTHPEIPSELEQQLLFVEEKKQESFLSIPIYFHTYKLGIDSLKFSLILNINQTASSNILFVYKRHQLTIGNNIR